ncbi:MAG: sugar phosphate isomerase/epimerase [Planctomycetota bacterium]|nr:sugar phosphate isomerase/epimerase [Planctomycetota bacterium]
MIRVSVTVSLVEEARGGPFVFWRDLRGACEKASALGFDGVEVFPPDAEAVKGEELRGMLGDFGLRLAAVGTGGGWVKKKLTLTMGEEQGRAAARGFVRSIIDFAGRLGAPAIVGSMQGRTAGGVDRGMAIRYLREALEQLGGYAKGYGVPLIYEPLNRYETDLANTVEGGLKVIEALSNVKLLADLFHMNIEEVDLAAAIRKGAKQIGHVHFADSNRRAAGLGHTDLGAVAEALREVRYEGYVSAEVLAWPDSEGAARQTMEAYRRWFGVGV